MVQENIDRSTRFEWKEELSILDFESVAGNELQLPGVGFLDSTLLPRGLSVVA